MAFSYLCKRYVTGTACRQTECNGYNSGKVFNLI